MASEISRKHAITDKLCLSVGEKTNDTFTLEEWNWNYFLEFPPRQEISIDIFPILKYQPLGVDFGPFDLATTCRFVRLIGDLLKGGRKLQLHVPSDPQKLTNMVVLGLAYLIGNNVKSAKQTRLWLRQLQQELQSQIVPFVCPLADRFPTVFELRLEDTLEALVFAKQQGWLTVGNLNIKEIEFFQQPENGDMSIVVPGKFVALAGPSSFPGEAALPTSLVPNLKSLQVSTIVRLNYPRYSADEFRAAGFRHYDVIFADGSCPEEAIIRKFLSICDSNDGLIAVHCKAGLGRTGTLIAFWLIRNFRISARVAIAWLRFARPGSVLGPQQQFLEKLSENIGWDRHGTIAGGDPGQGARLLKRRRTHS